VGGPITVQITGARRGDSEQPVILEINGGHQPWKPCKTALRLIAACTGSTKASAIVGRWVELYCDPSVRWGGREVGGIRMSGMSGLDRPITANLTHTRGKKKPHTVRPIDPPAAATPVSLDTVLRHAGVTPEAFNAWAADKGKPCIADMDDATRARVVAFLTGPSGGKALSDMRDLTESS
jgi:hypothetical protein